MTVLELVRGNVVTVTAIFTDALTGALVDPDTVSANVVTPTGATLYVAGAPDGVLVHDATGSYHLDVASDSAGWYRVLITSTGAHKAAQISEWRVLPDVFTP